MPNAFEFNCLLGSPCAAGHQLCWYDGIYVTIDMSDKQWVALATALSDLVEATGAENAIVADASEFLWCRWIAMNTYETIGVDRLWRLSMASASRPLEEGGRVALTRSQEEPFMMAQSFAGIYLLIVWFRKPFEVGRIGEVIEQALPGIERLTLELPPDGPLDPSIAARGRP